MYVLRPRATDASPALTGSVIYRVVTWRLCGCLELRDVSRGDRADVQPHGHGARIFEGGWARVCIGSAGLQSCRSAVPQGVEPVLLDGCARWSDLPAAASDRFRRARGERARARGALRRSVRATTRARIFTGPRQADWCSCRSAGTQMKGKGRRVRGKAIGT